MVFSTELIQLVNPHIEKIRASLNLIFRETSVIVLQHQGRVLAITLFLSLLYMHIANNNQLNPQPFNALGVHDRSVSDQVQTFSISEIHINRRAMTEGYGNDIALVKLSRPAMLNARVGLACMPSGKKTDRVTPGTMCYLTGI